MRIAELARRVGIAASAVRWYEGQGVIPEPPRQENGYREYADVDLAPLITGQRAAIARQRGDLDRLDGELLDLEMTIAAGGRASRKE